MTMEGKTHYVVEWIIDIYADTSREAAAEAQNIMKDPGVDWVFNVTNVKTKTVAREDLSMVELDEHKGIL